MNIDYLKEFAELAKRQNITETAHVLNMIQPTLSKHISALEKELGLSLFNRNGRSLSLTPEGMAILSSAYNVIDAYGALKAKAKELHKSPVNHFVISGLTNEGPSTEVLGFLLATFGERFGTDVLETKELHNMSPAEVLNEGLADVVFDPLESKDEPAEGGFSALHVGNVPLAAFVSPANPLAQHEELTLGDLRDSEIVRCEGIYMSRSWHYIDEAFGRRGILPKMRSHHCSNTADFIALNANLGSSVLIAGANFAERIPSGIASCSVQVPLSDEDAVIPFYFLYKEENSNPMLKYLVEFVKSSPFPAIRF